MQASRRIAYGAAVVLLASGVACSSSESNEGDGDGDEPPSGQADPAPVRPAQFDRVVPRPSCPNAKPARDPGAHELVVDFFRIQDACLVLRSEVVAEQRAVDRIRALNARPDVLSADLRPVGYRADGADHDDELSDPDREALRDIAELEADDLWELGADELDAASVRSRGPHALPGGEPVRVAVIELDGIDRDHPELRGVEIQTHPDTPDAVGRDTHATKVASLIAAADGIGRSRLIRQVEILSAAMGDFDSLADRIRWAVDNDAHVINLSIHLECPDRLFLPDTWQCGDENAQTAIQYARGHGVVVIASGGNEGEEDFDEDGELNDVQYPAAFDEVIAVAAHDREGTRAPFSTANETIDISAPGADIVVAGADDDLGCPDGYVDDDHHLWCALSGSSLSAPLVSATAAWLITRHPEASPAELEQALYDGARPAPDQDGRDDEYGHGYLDPLAADAALRGKQPGRVLDRLIAYRAGDPLRGPQRIGVADPATGRAWRLLDDAGYASDLRWSPDGHRLAVLTERRIVEWDVAAIAAMDLASADPAAASQRLDGQYYDIAFVDDTTIAALRAPPGSKYADPSSLPSQTLDYYDVRSGRQVRAVSTPALTRLVGPGPEPDTVLAIDESPGLLDPTDRPAHAVWLDRRGRELKRVELNQVGRIDETALSPDGRSLALVHANPSNDRLRLLDTATGRVRTLPRPTGGRPPQVVASHDLPRWTDNKTLLVSGTYSGPGGSAGVAAYRQGDWHPLDTDPLCAAVAVPTRAQAVVTRDRASDCGDLYLLHGRPYGEAGDVYAHPVDADRPLSRNVDAVWLSPGGKREPPFVLD